MPSTPSSATPEAARSRRILLLVVALAVVGAVAALTTVVVVTSDDDAASGPAAGAGRGAVTPVVDPGPAEVGAPAPGFTLPPLGAGDAVRLADYRGRPVVVNFWASWCTPCREEFPLLRAARAEHRDAGLEVIGVSFRDIASDGRRFAASERARWPLARDPDGALAAAYGVRGIPQTFMIAPDGTLAARVFGITTRAELDAALATILPDRRR